MVSLGATAAASLTDIMLDPGRAVAGTRGTFCVAQPEQTEGPYFVDESLNRSDIRADTADGQVKPGMPLALTLHVSRLTAESCEPLAGAQVDLWHCDALGVYSDVQDRGFNTVGQKFLRGYQVTDARGEVRFVAVYPGWYAGRTVHIHFKIRTAPLARPGLEFTSQLYFDDALTDRIHAAAPYAAKGGPKTRNRDDRHFRRGGDQLTLNVAERAGTCDASITIGLTLP